MTDRTGLVILGTRGSAQRDAPGVRGVLAVRAGRLVRRHGAHGARTAIPVDAAFGPGPHEAVRRILNVHGEFVADTEREKQALTFNPAGSCAGSDERARTLRRRTRLFVAHMQKTAGTTLRDRLRATLHRGRDLPERAPTVPTPRIAVISVQHLQERWAARGDEIRLLTGPLPGAHRRAPRRAVRHDDRAARTRSTARCRSCATRPRAASGAQPRTRPSSRSTTIRSASRR